MAYFNFLFLQPFLLFEALVWKKQVRLLTLQVSHRRSVIAFLLRDIFINLVLFPLSFSSRKTQTCGVHRDMIKWKPKSLVCLLVNTMRNRTKPSQAF